MRLYHAAQGMTLGNTVGQLQSIGFGEWVITQRWIKDRTTLLMLMTVVQASTVFVFDDHHFVNDDTALNTPAAPADNNNITTH